MKEACAQILLDADGRVLELRAISDRCREWWGGEIAGRSLSDLCPGAELGDALAEAAAQGQSVVECQFRRKDGIPFDAELFISALGGDAGDLRGYSVLVRDIGERNRSESVLVEWKNRYEAAIQSSGQLLYDWDPRTNDVTYGGDLERILGYDAGEMAGGLLRWISLVHPADRPLFLAEVDRVLATREPFDIEYRIRRKDGTLIDVAEEGHFVLNAAGEIVRMVGFVVDITERKRAEQGQRRLRVISDNVGDAYFIADERARLLYVNRAACEQLGYAEQELLGLSVPDIDLNFDTIRFNALFEAAAKGPIPPLESTLIRKDGSTYPIELSVSRVEVEGAPHLFGVARNITARKRAGQALRESEGLYRTLTEAMPQFVWSIRPDGLLTYANQLCHEYTGLTVDEINRSNWAVAVHPEDLPRMRANFLRGVQTGQSHETELRYRRSDGIYRWFVNRFVPVRDAEGRIISWVAVATDIDDRKRAEEAVRRSEERYRALVTATAQVVWQTDGAGNRIFSAAWHALTGQSDDEARGTGWLDAVHPLDRDRAERVWERAVETQRIYEDEVRVRTRDGGYRCFQLRGVPVLAADGSVREWVGTGVDITERRLAEEVLRESEFLGSSLDYGETLAAVAGLTVPRLADWCVVFLAERDGKPSRVETAFADPAMQALARELQHYPARPDAPAGVVEVMRTGEPELIPQVTDAYWQALAHDEEHLELLRHTGFKSLMLIPLTIRGRTIGVIVFAAGGSRHRYGPAEFTLAREVAQRAALAVDNAYLYEAERLARGEAEAANRAKDEFVATLSHELRTPLNAIFGWTQIVQSGKADAAMRARGLETIERNAKAQAKLIDDLLDISRMIMGKLRLEIETTELLPVIQSAVDGVRPVAEAKGIQFDVALDCTIGAVRGDPARLQQVAWNLLSNAVKFTSPGGRVEVRLERAQAESECALTITDTGDGIDPEFLPHVFDRFRQADGSTTRRHTGLGLGLAIVRHLVEMHGGAVRAESAGIGLGATFTVTLPLAEVPALPEEFGGRDAAAEARRRVSGPLRFVNLAGVRILVVDDEPDTLAMLGTGLEGYNADVRLVASVREALDAMDEWRPDVLVSDIAMPEEDGNTLIRTVRRLPPERGGHVPAIALTALAGQEDEARALSAGFQLHVPKPVRLDALAAAIAGLLEAAGASLSAS